MQVFIVCQKEAHRSWHSVKNPQTSLDIASKIFKTHVLIFIQHCVHAGLACVTIIKHTGLDIVSNSLAHRLWNFLDRYHSSLDIVSMNKHTGLHIVLKNKTHIGLDIVETYIQCRSWLCVKKEAHR